jgi:hypothetical protein
MSHNWVAGKVGQTSRRWQRRYPTTLIVSLLLRTDFSHFVAQRVGVKFPILGLSGHDTTCCSLPSLHTHSLLPPTRPMAKPSCAHLSPLRRPGVGLDDWLPLVHLARQLHIGEPTRLDASDEKDGVERRATLLVPRVAWRGKAGKDR